jgi:hypothetical protein
MKKLLLRSALFSTVLTFPCSALPHRYMPRVEAMAAPTADMDPHMSMTKLRTLLPGDKARADAVVAAAKKAAEHYRDYRVAEADGYTIFMPDQHQNVYHFVRESADPETTVNFDPNRPPALLYTKTDGPNPDYKLVGVMYTAPYGATEEELNARIPLSIAQWHEHINMCVPPQPEQRNWLVGDRQFGLSGSITTAEACRAAGGHFRSHLSGWMTHVYPFETDSRKVWSAGMDDDHGMAHDSMPGMKM